MFLLAQVSDLLYLFFLMFLSETIFKASREILYGVISTFFILKIILLYFYINNRKYSILYFISRKSYLIFYFLLRTRIFSFSSFVTLKDSLTFCIDLLTVQSSKLVFSKNL